MESEEEHCSRCGSVVYAFSSGIAVSNNRHYCIQCAEDIDRDYIEKNTCSVCTKLLGRREVKMVMPSRMYSSYFFDRLPVQDRIMCVDCYRKARRLHIISKPLMKIGRIRQILGSSIADKSRAAMDNKHIEEARA